jgi:hypothetical protein
MVRQQAEELLRKFIIQVGFFGKTAVSKTGWRWSPEKAHQASFTSPVRFP